MAAGVIISTPPGGNLGSIAVVADDFVVVAVEFEDADAWSVAAALPPLVAAAESEPELDAAAVGWSVMDPEAEPLIDPVSLAVLVGLADADSDSSILSIRETAPKNVGN